MQKKELMLEMALRYLRECKFSVFPVGRGKDLDGKEIKKPYVKWTDLQKRLPTEKEVTGWWKNWPGANIGFATGKSSGGIAVIDLDVDETTGSMDIAKENINGLIPDGLIFPVALTPSGGQHLYFHCDESLQSENVAIPCVHLRANKGFIILPPSYNSEKKEYVWMEGLSIFDTPIPEIPDEYVKKLRDIKSGENINSGNTLKDIIKNGVDKGARNGALAKISGYYFAKGFDFNETLEKCLSWNQLNRPPLKISELRITIESIFKIHQKSKGNQDTTFSGEAHTEEPEVLDEVGEENIESPIIPLDFDALPSFLKNVVEIVSPSTLAPDEFIATAFLTSMSAVIGTRAYSHFGSRKYCPTIWAMLIGPSSDYFKSTTIREARYPILKIDGEFEEKYITETALQKKIEGNEQQRIIKSEIDFSDDETIESFYQTLHDNPDGGLLAFDELGGWLMGFDRYKRGSDGGGEKRRWLTIFDNSQIKYKRKTDKINLSIKKPFVSLMGGITPNSFNQIFKSGTQDIENGFLPRFIFVKTPKLTKKDDTFLRPDISFEKLSWIYQTYKDVMELRSGAITPSQEGMEMLNDWYKQHQKQKKDPYYPDELAPFWRRLEGYVHKFALIFHQFKVVLGEEKGNQIPIQTLFEALSLVEYYKGQAWLVVRELCQGSDGRVFDDLIALLKKMGGEATKRQLQQASNYWRRRGEYLNVVLKKMESEGIVDLVVFQGVHGGKKGLKVKLKSNI